MRPRFPRCCIAALAAVWAGVASAESWTARFPGSPVITAVAIPVEDGRHFVTVAIPGVDPTKAALQQTDGEGTGPGGAARIFVDPVSRLVVFRIEGAAAPGAMSLRSSAPLGAGFSLQIPGGLRGTTLDWVKQVDGKILPLALLKVHYSGRPPSPGTPLLDGSGNLVAIAYTTAGETDGYALPAEVAKHVVESVVRDGSVEKARLGLTLLPSNPKPEIARILADSPASRSGLQVGDVLSEIGGRRIGDYADAVNAFYFLKPASTVSIKLLRAGQPVMVSLTPEGPIAK